MDKKKTAVEVYLSTVYKWGLIILVSACMCATITFNTEKIFGLYPEVPWMATIGLGLGFNFLCNCNIDCKNIF